MKVSYRSGQLLFELEGAGQKEVFERLSEIQEIFGEEKCGACKGESLRYAVRVIDDNKYFELHCTTCRARLAFGQHKKGGTLFPKRKDDDGNWLPNNGWIKWDGKKK